MTYFNGLPPSCPPAKAVDDDWGILWRFSETGQPKVVAEDLLSKAQQGKPCPRTVDECQWASCSFFNTENGAKALSRLPNFKDRQYFPVKIDKGLGKGLTGNNGHVDFWFFATTDLTLVAG